MLWLCLEWVCSTFSLLAAYEMCSIQFSFMFWLLRSPTNVLPFFFFSLLHEPSDTSPLDSVYCIASLCVGLRPNINHDRVSRPTSRDQPKRKRTGSEIYYTILKTHFLSDDQKKEVGKDYKYWVNVPNIFSCP